MCNTFTPTEFAKEYGINRVTVYRWYKEGFIRFDGDLFKTIIEVDEKLHKKILARIKKNKRRKMKRFYYMPE